MSGCRTLVSWGGIFQLSRDKVDLKTYNMHFDIPHFYIYVTDCNDVFHLRQEIPAEKPQDALSKANKAYPEQSVVAWDSKDIVNALKSYSQCHGINPPLHPFSDPVTLTHFFLDCKNTGDYSKEHVAFNQVELSPVKK